MPMIKTAIRAKSVLCNYKKSCFGSDLLRFYLNLQSPRYYVSHFFVYTRFLSPLLFSTQLS